MGCIIPFFFIRYLSSDYEIFPVVYRLIKQNVAVLFIF